MNVTFIGNFNDEQVLFGTFWQRVLSLLMKTFFKSIDKNLSA